MQRSEWVIDGVNKSGKSRSSKEKLPYYQTFKVTDDMGDAEKNFFTKFNTMQKILIDNGLMESK